MSADCAAIFCPVPLLNINAQCKKVVHINDGKTAPDLFSLQRYFVCAEHHASSSSSQTYHSQRLHTQFLIAPMLAVFVSSSPSYCRSSRHRSIYGAKWGGEKEGGGGVRQREREPLASKTNIATAAGPHSWGPPLEAASKERHSPGGPNYTKGRMQLQIGNNRIISLLPYQGYTVTQRQVIECNVQ